MVRHAKSLYLNDADMLKAVLADYEQLLARAAEVVAAWSREDDSVGEAIEVLARSLTDKLTV